MVLFKEKNTTRRRVQGLGRGEGRGVRGEGRGSFQRKKIQHVVGYKGWGGARGEG